MDKFIQRTYIYKVDRQPWYESKNIILSLQISVISHVLAFIFMFTLYTQYLCSANLLSDVTLPHRNSQWKTLL